MVYEYGAMSSRYSIEADNKLTAYAGMILHFGGSAAMIALYEPEESHKEDSWLFASPLEKRLDEIFGGEEGCFLKYMEEHKDEIKTAMETIKQLI